MVFDTVILAGMNANLWWIHMRELIELGYNVIVVNDVGAPGEEAYQAPDEAAHEKRTKTRCA